MENFTKPIVRVYEFVENQGISINKFSRNLGVSNSYFGKMKQNNGSMGDDVIEKILRTYPNVNSEWLLLGRGEMIKQDQYPNLENDFVHSIVSEPMLAYGNSQDYKKIPLVSISAVGGFGNANFAIQTSDVKDYYVVPKFKDRSIDFMIEIVGNSMATNYNSGDVVACTVIKESKFIQYGRAHIISTTEQGILLKRLYPSADNSTDTIECRSDNAAYPAFNLPKQEITGMAIVVGVIRIE